LHGRLEGKPGAGAGLIKERRHNVPIRRFVGPELVRRIRQLKDLLDLIIGQISNRYEVAPGHSVTPWVLPANGRWQLGRSRRILQASH
jgi:hypothetical protein